MKNYIFWATPDEIYTENLLLDFVIDTRHINNPVTLKSESESEFELSQLCELFSLKLIEMKACKSYSDFKRVEKLEYERLFNEDEFNALYTKWIKLTEREHSMDE